MELAFKGSLGSRFAAAREAEKSKQKARLRGPQGLVSLIFFGGLGRGLRFFTRAPRPLPSPSGTPVA
jgi:hypothetical protein